MKTTPRIISSALVKSMLIAVQLMLLSACQSDSIPSLPGVTISGTAIAPNSGYARETEFTFSASLNKSVSEDYAVVLALFSPNTDNEWDWLHIDMTPSSETAFTLKKALAEHSTAYKFKYGVEHIESGDLVVESAVFNGPELLIDAEDNTPPEVLRTYPVDMSVGVSPTQELTFIFSEVIDPATVDVSNILVADNKNTAATVQAFQNRVVVSFTTPFGQIESLNQEAAQYTVSVQNVRDLNGNSMLPYEVTFHIESPVIQTFAIESRKYSGNCIAVKDIKKRFAAPEEWNPVVEIESCVEIDDDLSQRWFLQIMPGNGGYGQIAWASNYDYCLSKKSASNPIIERCDSSKSEQRFALNAKDSYYLINSEHGGCVAVGIVDVGAPNKVESSLCTSTLQRNHWSFHEREQTVLAPAFMIGNYNIRHADIQYSNPAHGVDLTTEETRELVMYLYQTEATNQAQIAAELNLLQFNTRGEGFSTDNPYFPRYNGSPYIAPPAPRSAEIDGSVVINPEGYSNIEEGYLTSGDSVEYFQQPVVTQWFSDVTNGEAAANQVCAVKFFDEDNVQYELKTFDSKDAALLAGYTITHQYKCGTCSTLKDLAVYIGIPDQTSPVRLCTKRGRASNDNLDQVKECLIASVGFTEMCAESWAYNGIHTGQECQGTCMATYGNDALFFPKVKGFFSMVIAEKFNACPAEVESPDPEFRAAMDASGCPLANETNGKLNACLWCDEKTSGPGFKYAAGRTRRGSGLESAIPRPNDTLYYEANHTLYFD